MKSSVSWADPKSPCRFRSFFGQVPETRRRFAAARRGTQVALACLEESHEEV